MRQAFPSICMLIYSYYPEATGGAERQCHLQAKELARQGYTCMVLAASLRWSTPRRQWDQGCEIIRCRVLETFVSYFRKPSMNSKPCVNSSVDEATSSSRKIIGSWAAAVIRWLNALLFMLGAGWTIFRRRRGIDVIHVHGADWHAGFAGWIGHHLSIPVVCKGANVPVFPSLTGIPFARTFNVWRRRIHYTALTSAMRDDLQANGVADNRITILPNGVKISTVERDFPIEPLVLHIANYTQPAWNKAFDVLFSAWPLVVRKYPAARLVAAGAGDVSKWKSKLRDADSDEQVEFIGYQENLDDWFRRAAIFVLPSRHEGISNALLEAQGFGIPAVVSDISGNCAVVLDGLTGLVVPVGDEAALAQAMIRLLSDLDLRSRMGKAARCRIQAEFSIETVVQKMGSIYQKLWVEAEA